MLRMGKVRVSVVVLGCVSALTACGGGTGNTGAVSIPQGASIAQIDDFRSAYGTSLDGTANPAVVGGAAFQDLFDTTFLDGGFTRADIVAALNGEATALPAAATTGHSGVPRVSLSDVSVFNCAPAGEGVSTCSLTASVTNSDVDKTVVTLNSTLRLSAGKLRLAGDRTSATN